jgi:hypothetical protein
LKGIKVSAVHNKQRSYLGLKLVNIKGTMLVDVKAESSICFSGGNEMFSVLFFFLTQ